MTFEDLIFAFSFFLNISGFIILVVFLIFNKKAGVKKLVAGLVVYDLVYASILAGVGLFSPQRIMQMHEMRCFDDWCITVEQVESRPTIGSLHARGSFYLVSLVVSSQAKRIRQRELDTGIYLLDERGIRYDPSIEGQNALADTGQSGLPLNSWLDPGTSFSHIAVFDMPVEPSEPGLVITHGPFPGLIIIGDDQSLFHKPTIIRLYMQ